MISRVPALGAGGPDRLGPALRRRLAPVTSVLAVASAADIATTAVALAWGAHEKSPGGALALAAAGLVGLVVLKLLAMIFVWALSRGWPPVGQAVGWGLAGITGAAVVWNLSMLGRALSVA